METSIESKTAVPAPSSPSNKQSANQNLIQNLAEGLESLKTRFRETTRRPTPSFKNTRENSAQHSILPLEYSRTTSQMQQINTLYNKENGDPIGRLQTFGLHVKQSQFYETRLEEQLKLNSKLVEQSQTLKQKLKSEEQRQQMKKTKLGEIRANIEELKIEETTRAQRSEELEKEKKHLSSVLENLKKETAEMEVRLERKAEQAARTDMEVESKQAQLEKLRAETAECLAELEVLKADEQKSKEEALAATVTVRKLREQSIQANFQRSELLSQIDKMQQEEDALKEDMSAMEQRIRFLERENDELIEQLARMEGECYSSANEGSLIE